MSDEQKSLLAQSTTLPAVVTGDNGTLIQVGPPAFKASTYVTFASPRKTDQWLKFQTLFPGIQDGAQILVRPEPRPSIKLDPFRFHLIAARQFYAEVADDGVMLRVTWDRPTGQAAAIMKEHIDTMLLVYTKDGLVPATCRFKTTKCGAVHKASDTLKLAMTPAWASLGEAYAKSLAAPEPWARFTATVTVQARTARMSGRKYIGANSTITPTAEAEWEAIAAFLNAPENVQALADVQDSFAIRLQELQRLCA